MTKSFVGLEALETKSLLSSVQEATLDSHVMQAATVAPLTVSIGPDLLAVASKIELTSIVNALPGTPVTLFANVMIADLAGSSLSTLDSSYFPNLSGKSLTFLVDGVVVGAATLTAQNYSLTPSRGFSNNTPTLATASFTTTFSTLGPHQITATLDSIPTQIDGVPALASSTSDPFTVTVVSAPAPDAKAPVSLEFKADQRGNDVSGATLIEPYELSYFYSGGSPNGPGHVLVYVVSDQVLSVGGTISLYEGDTLVGTLPVLPIDRGGAEINTPTSIDRGGAVFVINQAGDHAFRAVYSGDEAHQGATGTFNTSFIPGDYVVRMTGPNSLNLGQSLTVDVSVAHEGLGTQDLTGVLTVDGIGTVAIDATGHGSFTVNGLTVGLHHYTASYVAPDGQSGSTSKFNGPERVRDTSLTVVVGDRTELLVSQLYKDLLNREAENAGVVYWSGLIRSGVSQTSVVQQIMSSAEYHASLVQSYYHDLLGRQAGEIEVPIWADKLDAGADPLMVQAAIIASNEFSNAAESDATFLGKVYLKLLNRPIDDASELAWSHLLSNGTSRFTVVVGIMSDTEYRDLTINSYYNKYLMRPSDPAGLSYWSDQLGQQPQTLVLAQFLGSEEYSTLLQAKLGFPDGFPSDGTLTIFRFD